MNRSEQRLWAELRKLDANFRRQAPIGRYFADFASYGRKLVIEVDGGVHERIAEVAARDVERQAWLEGEGYQVVRFSTGQVANDLPGVVRQVALLLDGGGLGGGGSAEVTSEALFGVGAEHGSPPHLTAFTTIPGPSSIEEEGR